MQNNYLRFYLALLGLAVPAQSLFAQPVLPDFSLATFSNSLQIDHPYFPLNTGSISTFNVQDIDPVTGEVTPQLIIVEVLAESRSVAGIPSRVVRDRVFEGGLVREDTFDWYAQDNSGNVWYMGEDVTDFEYDAAGNLIGTSHPGTWEAGINGASPGFIMPANPQIGDHYFQEYSAGIAQDQARVTGVSESFVVPSGRFTNNVLRTRDSTTLEPGTYAHKYYAPGVGQIADRSFTTNGNTLIAKVDRNPQSILPAFDASNFSPGATIDNSYFPVVPGRIYNYAGEEFDSQTGETMVLGFQETHTSRTRDILGITTQIVRGLEFHDGLMFEDSDFYYAQDEAGNVWWMGEKSTKFEYDEAGNLVRTYDDSTWIAGVNGAKPGYYMPSNPVVGASHYEIFSPNDGDLDHADILSVSEHVPTVLGQLDDVVKVFEASDFKLGFYAHKDYAPGLGLVRVQEDFDAFGNPRVVLELTSLVPEPGSVALILMASLLSLRHHERKASRSKGHFLVPRSTT